MRKTDKKLDNQIRIALTDVCDVALREIDGFQWLTHLVNYANFPQSLRIVCVFDTNNSLSHFSSGNSKDQLLSLIQKHLSQANLHLKKVDSHVSFDSEEDCDKEHNGKWAERLK